jgi:hypothetical protein
VLAELPVVGMVEGNRGADMDRALTTTVVRRAAGKKEVESRSPERDRKIGIERERGRRGPRRAWSRLHPTDTRESLSLISLERAGEAEP